MASLAQTRIEVPVAAMQASERLVAILVEHGYTLEDGSLPGAAELVFKAKAKALRNALVGSAIVTANGAGSTIELWLDVAPGQSKALLDGRRNRATLQELTDDVALKIV